MQPPRHGATSAHDTGIIRLEQPCGAFKISAQAHFAGKDLCVLILGGDKPHVGCVSLGIPRESLNKPGERSATVSTLNVTGHKDDTVGNLFAQYLATRLGCVVAVTCGIHVEQADAADINDLIRATQELLKKLESYLCREPDKL